MILLRPSIAAMLATLSVQADVVVHRPPAAPEGVAAWRAGLREGRPALRGFRAPILGLRSQIVPVDLPDDPELRRIAVAVSRQLAPEGILAATGAAIGYLAASGRTIDEASLRAVGIPVDWLAHFRGPEGPAGPSGTLLGRIASGAEPETLRRELDSFALDFRQSVSGFAVATESGEHEIETVRLQLTRGTPWLGPGDGGSLDVARQLLLALPGAEFVASVQAVHLEDLLGTIRSWRLDRPERLAIVAEPLPVAQWAQDNGKPGFAPAPEGADREVVTLVPRYASRGEDGAVLVPGETFALEGFASLGHRVVQSPLLFQGGDLLAARHPGTGERLLLLGEANVWRNTALGLSEAQVLEAFQVEFGVDRCLVLPAVSFHVDQEVTLRAIGDRLVAFVADPASAARIVLRIGTERLEAARVLTPADATKARSALEAGSNREYLAIVEPAVAQTCPAFGRFPAWLAERFSGGGTDSGVGNLQRFLLALDLLASESLALDELPRDPHSIAYLRSFRRRAEDRRILVGTLRDAGLEIVPVPSLPETTRGIDYLNGLQEPLRYLMPAWGGVYSPLDRAAEDAFRSRLGESGEIRPILTGESQRRGGALHCSISALPRP